MIAQEYTDSFLEAQEVDDSAKYLDVKGEWTIFLELARKFQSRDEITEVFRGVLRDEAMMKGLNRLIFRDRDGKHLYSFGTGLKNDLIQRERRKRIRAAKKKAATVLSKEEMKLLGLIQ